MRLDGIPALDLWDLIVAVLVNTNRSNKTKGDPRNSLTRKKIHGKIDDLDNVDFISSNLHSSRKEALLYVFEDNEAVIVKSMPPNTENWLRKRYNYRSTEDKHETNYINKNDTNTHMRKLHNQ